MNLLRMRIQGTLRLLPLWLVVGALNFGILTGLLTLRAASLREPLSAGAVTVLAWAGIAIYLVVSGVRQRASAFDLTLPVTARQLWLAHVASTLGVVLILAVATAAVAVAQVRLLNAPGSLPIGPGQLAALLVGASILELALLELPFRQLHRMPFTTRTFLWAVGVVCGVSLLLGALAGAGPAAALVLPVVGVAVGWQLWRTLPAGFTLVTRAAENVAAESSAGEAWDSEPSAARGARAVRWAIVRSVALTPKDAIAWPLLVLFGLVLGGALTPWTGDADLEDLRFLYIPMATYVLFVLTGPRLESLHRLDPLPIPRSRVLAWLLIPHFACFVLGYGAGVLSTRMRPTTEEFVQMVERDGEWRPWVPVWARSIAWDGRIPEVGSPGGEAHVPRGLPLLPGLRAVLYSPYDAPRGSSLQFVAQQIARATEAVYGTAIPAGEIATRYLETRTDGSVAPKAGGLHLRGDHPELQPRSVGPLLPLFASLVAVPWLLLVAGLFRTYRSDIGAERGQQLVWGVIVLFVVVFIGLSVLLVRGVIHAWAPRALLGVAAHALGASPAGTAAAWLGTAVLIGLGSWLVERQFHRMEIPTRPLRFSLVYWPRE